MAKDFKAELIKHAVGFFLIFPYIMINLIGAIWGVEFKRNFVDNSFYGAILGALFYFVASGGFAYELWLNKHAVAFFLIFQYIIINWIGAIGGVEFKKNFVDNSFYGAIIGTLFYFATEVKLAYEMWLNKKKD